MLSGTDALYADGRVGVGNALPSPLDALLVAASSASNEAGLRVNLTNNANGARGIAVNHAGVGPGVFADSRGGNGVWGITQTISGAGVLGDNFSGGEAVVGRSNGNSGVGAVVGRNDGSGSGVRGFNTKDGIGVLGQSGISGGTGVAGRFENVNAANANAALEASTSGAGPALQLHRGRLVTNVASYTSDAAITSAVLRVTTTGNLLLARAQEGTHVWVANASGGNVNVTNAASGALTIANGRVQHFIRIGAEWFAAQ